MEFKLEENLSKIEPIWNLQKLSSRRGSVKDIKEKRSNSKSNYIFNVVGRNRTSTAIISKPGSPKLGRYNPNYGSIDK